MTVSNPSAIAGPYVGNGVTTEFSPSLRILADADLVLTLLDTATDIETTLLLNVDYTVSGAGTFFGCVVTLTSPLAVGKTLTIRRVVSLVQLSDFRNQGAFFRELHEDAFDYLMMVCQQQQEQINRVLAIADTFPDEELLQVKQKFYVKVSPVSGSKAFSFTTPTIDTTYQVIVTTSWVTPWSIPDATKLTTGFIVLFGNESPDELSDINVRVYA